jgi:hypothetical protein
MSEGAELGPHGSAIRTPSDVAWSDHSLHSGSSQCANLGTAPAFNKAVQGQQATTVEGTVLNIVNWSCNVIAPVVGIACLGVGAWHYKSGRGFGGWLATGVGLMVISGLGRMAEGFITQAQGIN